jgi:threonylcarbamoyladenosine tRNA methylthiotransferase MtaB
VLVEKNDIGRTEQFMTIKVPGYAPGQIVPVLVTGMDGENLIGEAVRTAA